MEAKEMNELLLSEFPELHDEFNTYVAEWEGMDTGAFLTYEDVLRPYWENALLNHDTEVLERASCFIERLVKSGDVYAENVAYVGLLEGLKANCDNEAVLRILKPVSAKLFEELVY